MARRKSETMVCRHCNGTGRVVDPRMVGDRLRGLRLHKGVSLRSLAKCLNISAPYLSDMELGRRGWSPKWIKAVEAALK